MKNLIFYWKNSSIVRKFNIMGWSLFFMGEFTLAIFYAYIGFLHSIYEGEQFVIWVIWDIFFAIFVLVLSLRFLADSFNKRRDFLRLLSSVIFMWVLDVAVFFSLINFFWPY